MVTATFACIPLGVSLWALLDAAHRPGWAWALAGRRRIVWIVVILFGILTVIGGLIISGVLPRQRPAPHGRRHGDITNASRPGRALDWRLIARMTMPISAAC